MQQEQLQEEITSFLRFIFKDQTGTTYLATKEPITAKWTQHFYDWPSERDQMANDAIEFSYTKSLDVFYSPSLFTAREVKKMYWMGTFFQWCEFDGGSAPDIPSSGAPIPTIVVQSSTKGNEHWYYQLDEFQTSQEDIEKINERLAYGLGADRSGWDCNQVLRLPGLRHQNKKLTSKLVSLQEGLTYRVDNFSILPDPPPKSTNVDELPPITELPSIESLILRFKWTEDVYKVFKSVPEVGKRSSTLTALGFHCIEMGMDDKETLAILLDADNRWGKFAGRSDQMLRLHGIIVHCRSRKAQKKQAARELVVVGLQDFLKKDVKIEWIYEGIAYRQAMVVLGGPPGVGKSLLSLQLCLQGGLGRKFLGRTAVRPARIIYVSMEMNYAELKIDLDKMTTNLGDAELEQLQENFLLVPVGSPVHLDKLVGQESIYRVVDAFRPDGIIFDSLGKATSDKKDTSQMTDFLDEYIQGEFGCFVWFIHHPRKGQVGNKKPRTLDDFYGDMYIGANTSIALSLWPTGGKGIMTFDFLKSRIGSQEDTLVVKRDPNTLITDIHKTPTGKQKPSPPPKDDTDKRGLLDV